MSATPIAKLVAMAGGVLGCGRMQSVDTVCGGHAPAQYLARKQALARDVLHAHFLFSRAVINKSASQLSEAWANQRRG
jgi:predicted NBD/HSP70 family sugar kinase